MADESVFEKAIGLIQRDQLEESLKLIAESLLKECVMLMASISGRKDKYELYSLFYDNFLDVAGRIKDGKFEFVSDSAFKSYFKTGCSHKIKEQNRFFRKSSDWLEIEFFERNVEGFENFFYEEKKDGYAQILKEQLIDLNSVETEEDFPLLVIRAFHSLNEKCKFLVVMKYMLNLSHKDIVDCLCNFYELKNENVSKTELKRCLDQLKKKTGKSLN
ncbi:MAG: hypothetical protein U1C46_01615 [Bacteroidales bacterium]|nr:hypothetical protein [Bacteroidales bacterium]